RRGVEVRLAPADDTIRTVFARSRSVGRRTGAVMLTDADGRLCGLFTDSDLARLFERRGDAAIDRPIREVMTAGPITVPVGGRVRLGVLAAARRAGGDRQGPLVEGGGRAGGRGRHLAGGAGGRRVAVGVRRRAGLDPAAGVRSVCGRRRPARPAGAAGVRAGG